MTLSHEPWLVLRPGVSPGRANHVKRLLVRNFDEANCVCLPTIATAASQITIDATRCDLQVIAAIQLTVLTQPGAVDICALLLGYLSSLGETVARLLVFGLHIPEGNSRSDLRNLRVRT